MNRFTRSAGRHWPDLSIETGRVRAFDAAAPMLFSLARKGP
jgi:hypothetical protein